MLELRPIPLSSIEHWVDDFKARAKAFESPSNESETIGIFTGPRLIGYFIIAGHRDGTVEIQQGYLTKEARHEGYEYRAMHELEQRIKEFGFSRIILQTQRSLKAYNKFMKRLGFNVTSIVFSKEVV